MLHLWPVETIPERGVRLKPAEMSELVVCEAEEYFSPVLYVWDE
jgi:hypothetical protein